MRNPLDPDALNADSVKTGDRIVTWKLDHENDRRYLTIVNVPYTDDDGDRVIDVRDASGRESTELTSELGLSGARHSGEWYAFAEIDKSE